MREPNMFQTREMFYGAVQTPYFSPPARSHIPLWGQPKKPIQELLRSERAADCRNGLRNGTQAQQGGSLGVLTV